MAGTAKWYVVFTYSGYENTVKATIEKVVENRQLQDQIQAIAIPIPERNPSPALTTRMSGNDSIINIANLPR